MATTTAPIKISAETDALVGHAAHFLGRAKKDLVETAVVEYIDNHRDEINAAALVALREISGSPSAAVALIAGITPEELDAVGGMPETA